MLDIAVTCRTCMKHNVILIDLFQTVKIEENSCIQLVDMLKECTTAQVSEDDGLPHNLCNECAKMLQLSYTFRKQANRSEQELKRLILIQSQIKNEDIEVTLKSEHEPDYFNYYDELSFESFPKQELADGDYKCNQCGKQFTKEKKFLKHMESHKLEFPCTYCKKTFVKQSTLDKHLAKHCTHKCNICSETFDTQALLLDHMVIHSSNVEVKVEFEEKQEKFKCPECDISFAKSRSLAMHMKKHRGKNKANDGMQFVCDVCGKDFTVKSLLRRHLKLHSDVRPYKCTKCPKKYSRQDQLNDHINKHNGLKPNICSFCEKAFSQLCSLKDHLRTHTGETPYLCSQCGKGFSNSSNLRQHMMRHTGLKPFACNMCPKTFCTKGQMTSHMTSHSGAHPYKCGECGAAFTKPNSLKKHSFIHLGLRPFACDTCNMRFTCKDHLKRHYRIHTGEKPYRCNFCERAFTQSNDLVKHTRSHIGQNIYPCTVCGQRFRLASDLKLHYPIHFNGKTPTSQEQKDEQEPTGADDVKTAESVKSDGRFTITINSCDENGVVGDITINISPEKS